MATAIEIFCCYARYNQPLVQRLKNHLMPLQRQGLIQIWSNTDIDAGDAWEQAINQHLETADILLLLSLIILLLFFPSIGAFHTLLNPSDGFLIHSIWRSRSRSYL